MRLYHVPSNPVLPPTIHESLLKRDFRLWIEETMSLDEQDWWQSWFDLKDFDTSPFRMCYIDSLIENDVEII